MPATAALPIEDAAAEERRLAALERYDILDSPPEESFDRITRVAQAMLETPIVLVSLVDRERQWFKSRRGLAATETPREISFCTHAIRSREPLVVGDAVADARFHDNPLVVGEPHIRFYVGVPLRTGDGHNLGTLCAIDRIPRQPTPQQLAVLQDLARIVVDELELRRMATTDSLTGALTRRAFEAQARHEIERARRYGGDLACLVADLDDFKAINDSHGHAAGDVVLQGVADALRRTLRKVDVLGRQGGDEFVAVLPATSLAQARTVTARIASEIAALRIQHGGQPLHVAVSIGVAQLEASDKDFAALVARADAALYDAKRASNGAAPDA